MNVQNIFLRIGMMLVIALALASTGCLNSKAKEEVKPKAPKACEIVLTVSGMS